MPVKTYPILYSFRRCPYAMRARLALWQSGIQVELREIELKRKPDAMLTVSAKGTVPVLILPDNRVIDESLGIMQWALSQSNERGWMGGGESDGELGIRHQELILRNDQEFKKHLDHYKYAVRFPEASEADYRAQGEAFLHTLEELLSIAPFLSGERFGLADAAIAPFIRQFSMVDNAWFDQSPYSKLRAWLREFIESPRFQSVMKKYPRWDAGAQIVLFGQGVG